jgi:hypothetical protein
MRKKMPEPRTSQPATFQLHQSQAVLVDRLTCNGPDLRRSALRSLAIICYRGDAAHLLLLVEHTAKWSEDPNLQRESIDLLALLGETERLISLNFELGSQAANDHRNAVLRRLKH